ncbi:hypothetical protein Q3G72_030788 [Acer saccharum]|nr:hypothetical protein Q3G72_030788 [Acer saccharum]
MTDPMEGSALVRREMKLTKMALVKSEMHVDRWKITFEKGCDVKKSISFFPQLCSQPPFCSAAYDLLRRLLLNLRLLHLLLFDLLFFNSSDLLQQKMEIDPNVDFNYSMEGSMKEVKTYFTFHY